MAQTLGASSILQATHVRLLLRDNESPKRTLKFARKYSAASSSPSVWLARLDAEKACNRHDINSAWTSARTVVASSEDENGIEKIWLWGLDNQSGDTQDRQAAYEVNVTRTHEPHY